MSDEQLWDWYRIDEEMEKHYKAHGNTYQFIWVRELCREILADGEQERAKLLQQVKELEDKWQYHYKDTMQIVVDAVNENKQLAARIAELEAELAETERMVSLETTQAVEIGRLRKQLAEREAWKPMRPGMHYLGDDEVGFIVSLDGSLLTMYPITGDEEFDNEAGRSIQLDPNKYRLCRRQSEASDE